MSDSAATRIGLIVPSSNTTIETEVPAMLRSAHVPTEFTFHSSRAVMHTVDAESLNRMVGQSERCAGELADAHVDVLVYACLVALMAKGARAHEAAEADLSDVVQARLGRAIPTISSAGALVRTVGRLGLSRVAIVTPYVPELTAKVRDYLQAADIEVVADVSLGVADNVAVGRLDPGSLPEHVATMDLSRAQAVIASACVQMPSLAVIPELERRFDMPVLTAATATVFEVMRALDLPLRVPAAGSLLWDDDAGRLDDPSAPAEVAENAHR